MKSALAIFVSLSQVATAARVTRVAKRDRARNASKVLSGGQGSYHMKVEMNSAGGCQVLEARWGQVHRLALDGIYDTAPNWAWQEEEDREHSEEQLFDIWGPSEEAVRERARERCGALPPMAPRTQTVSASSTKTVCLVCNGESSNRIDVVFMGDGYTLAERDRMFDDMQRLTDEMFAGETFRSWLPLFNIWAIHVESQESGIGYNGRPKDTPFGLYKQGTQHRGVFPSSSGRNQARTTCDLAGGCDYPSIIGNDEYYGGLGGEFVIGTRSRTTGTVVLRHEMGHNFVDVGEEYDGGGVYSGVNSDSSLSGIKWQHWLTDPNNLREERQRLPLQEYPWVDLAGGRRSFSFSADGSYARWKMSFTVSGIPEEGALIVKLDGQALDWRPTKPPGAERPDGSTMDRQFYHFEGPALSSGTHTVTFESGFAPPSGAPIRQLCSVRLHEFGSDADFNNQEGFIGAYPTWSSSGRKTYRPTNDMCLMRTMESTQFCNVCKEGMWHQFLMRMSLVDDVEVSNSEGTVNVELKAVPLAQFRAVPVPGLTESYAVVWTKDGVRQDQLADQFTFTGTEEELAGFWEVELTLSSSEVRSDPDGLLTSRRGFSVGSGGGGNWVVSGSGCTMDGQCIQSKNFPSNYGNNEACTIQISGQVNVNVESFATERSYDKLFASGVEYSGAPPSNLASLSGVHSGTITWSSDYSVTNGGWRICRT